LSPVTAEHRLRAAFVAIATLVVSPMAWAHETGKATAPGWSFEPWVVAPLVLSLAWFLIGAARLHRRGADRATLGRRTACFLAGCAILAGALVSPLHAAGARSFTAHMLEHELLMLGAAPLLVLSAPVGIALWALPHQARLMLGRAGRAPAWHAPWAAFSGLGAATALQAIALWAWHAPSLFSLALVQPGWHIAQHACFLGTALLFWHAVWRAPVRTGIGGVVGALFFTAAISGALGALMAVAHGPWYARYAALGMTPFGLTPLEDQQLAGVLMWVPGGLVHAGAALWLLARALRRPMEVRDAT
jgi:cytochrome c oxidase assembly factor CtaG